MESSQHCSVMFVLVQLSGLDQGFVDKILDSPVILEDVPSCLANSLSFVFQSTHFRSVDEQLDQTAK